MYTSKPGPVVLLGSGETLPSSGKSHEYAAGLLPENPHIAIMETPAGFEPNSDVVAERIKTFLERRLQNYRPRVVVVPARRKGSVFSTDNAEILSPLLTADEILLGPGSPTYSVRQLESSLALEMINARQRRGTVLFLSSSAPLSFSAFTLPVYEIYKVGTDLHWVKGLDFFQQYNLHLTFITHWNNNDGGDELDTSRCYMGQERFGRLFEMLPDDQLVVGIDEHTSLIVDITKERCFVRGNDSVTILRRGDMKNFSTGSDFPLDELGEWKIPEDHQGIRESTWEMVIQAEAQNETRQAALLEPPEEVLKLVEKREQARQNQDWHSADNYRNQITVLGWQINDTTQGIELTPLKKE